MLDSGTMRWEERRQEEMGLQACLLYPLMICCSFLIDSVGLTTGRTDEGEARCTPNLALDRFLSSSVLMPSVSDRNGPDIIRTA